MKVDEIQQIAVVGAGLMGHGIAQEFALAGYEVHLNGRSEEKLQHALKNIQGNLQRLVEFNLATRDQADLASTRIHASPVLGEVVSDVDMVVEAVFENLPLKQQLFREMDGMCPTRTILASNTSSFMPSQLASATQRPDRVLGTHYYNPPYLLPLVEVVRGPQTSDETLSTVHELLQRVGKSPVIVQKEVPGFIGNRLQFALAREALFLVQSGIASPQDVDTVVKTSLGRRWAVAGPLEVGELAGWDIALAVASYLQPELDGSPEVSPLLRERVSRGELGVKTGKGFYEWTPESAEALKRRIQHALIEIAQWTQEA